MRGRSVAIVGGGIVGCLIARELLRQHPETAVVVIERDLLGSGSTRRSAGLHIPRGISQRVRRMAESSQTYYAAMKAARPDLPIFPVAMSIVAAAESLPRLGQIYLDTAQLTPVDMPASLPLQLPSDARVWNVSGAHYADVQRLAQEFGRELRAAARVLEGVAVAAVDCEGETVTLQLATGETLTVDQVAIAPGPWVGAAAWSSLLEPIKARVKKVVALHVDCAPMANDRTIIFHDEDAFLLPLVHRGHWLFSYTSREWGVDPDSIASTLSPDTLAEARDVLCRYAPALANASGSGRVFCDAYSMTGEPEITALDEKGRIVFVGAANGSGYRLAPAMAAEAVTVLQNSNVWSRS